MTTHATALRFEMVKECAVSDSAPADFFAAFWGNEAGE
jgi:hypothetical protein